MNSQVLNLHAWIPRTRALGPGLRAALWTQGCPLRCPDCMTPAALPAEGGTRVAVRRVVDELIALDDIEGITLSGGEPFAQAGALAALITGTRQQRDLGVIIYSGYTLSKLTHLAKKQLAIANLLNLTDLLIDGPYLAAQNDGLSLRGSANQRIHPLTPRYRELIAEHYGAPTRPVEVHVLENEVMMVGVPGRKALIHWQQRLRPLLR